MLLGPSIILVSFLYLGVLFAIAYYCDRRADAGRSLIANPYIYALSLAVYCTTWTFYGSVGRAAATGIGFLPIYLGPTLIAALWSLLLVKMIRISKTNRITSIADFVASRYGKSPLLGGLVTVIAVVGVVPYISLQLKAVSNSFGILLGYPEVVMPVRDAVVPLWQDTALMVALVLAAFTILFGARHLDATERHEGMVAAVAFESIVKLVAFGAVGLYVTFGLFDGFGDIFARAAQRDDLARLLQVDARAGSFGSWASLTLLSMLSVMFLPRQFQIAVVENVDESHVRKAIWLFPLYLLAINVFVLPIALGGLMEFGGSVDADTFVLTLPIKHAQPALAVLVFIGGLAAATGMVIVETIALSTMVCNDLVMPLLLRTRWLQRSARRDLSRVLLGIRRGAIALILLLGYAYFRAAGEAYALVGIGLISFAAVAQFAPVIVGGMFWRAGTRNGALAGLVCGFTVWAFTLLLPSFAKSGWVDATIMSDGVFGIGLLRPTQLFGLAGLDEITHCLFWSLCANVGAFVGVSLAGRASAMETTQAMLFVDAMKSHADGVSRFWRGRAQLTELRELAERFLGPEPARRAFERFAAAHGVPDATALVVDARLVHFTESLLAGAIGSASARAMMASVVEEEPLGLDEVMNILDEANQVRAYSRQLEAQSRDLERATAELRAANARLQELDRLKDDFMSSVTHELRTPLTSIRALSEILFDNPDMAIEERQRFLGIITGETERLTRLVNQVLDMAKIESNRAEWRNSEVSLVDVIDSSIESVRAVYEEKGVVLARDCPESVPLVLADRDRLIQVMLNLLSNAVKFVEQGGGQVLVRLRACERELRVEVVDNGTGVPESEQQLIFEKFHQVGDVSRDKPQGTGLGLPISRQIIEHFGGRIWVESQPGEGAKFSFVLPLNPSGVERVSLVAAQA